MSKSLCRLLYLAGLLFAIIGGLLIAHGFAGSRVLPNGSLHPAHITSAIAGIILSSLAGVMGLAAWIGALFKTARLHRWGWFICLLIFSGITLLLYIFVGPTTPTYPRMPVTTPPYGGFGD